MEEAFKRYQKKKMCSNYQDMYGASLDDKYKYNNILKYKDFDNVINILKCFNLIYFSLNMLSLSKRNSMNLSNHG